MRFNGLSLVPYGIMYQELWFSGFGYKNMEKGCFEILNPNGQNLKNDQVWMNWIFKGILIILSKYMC